jgi:hypothetical protein
MEAVRLLDVEAAELAPGLVVSFSGRQRLGGQHLRFVSFVA